MSNIVQTFFVDPAALSDADSVGITSVNLYFHAKPDRTTNETGIVAPGVTVGICRFDQSTTTVNLIASVRLPYDSIYDSSDSSAATSFSFERPIILETNKRYGVVVLPEDGGYDLWVNRAGDRIVGTNDPSGGATTNRNGRFFSFTGETISNEQTNTSLKMAVSIAKYTDTSVTVDLVNDSYEFFTVDTRDDVFVGGEWVFANTALLTGNVSVTANSSAVVGTGTAFNTLTIGQSIVLQSSAFNHVATVASVTNATSMSIDPPVPFTNTVARYRNGVIGRVVKDDHVSSKVILRDSTANSTAFFAPAQLITGAQSQASAIITSVDNISADKLVAHVDATTTAAGSLTSSYTIAYQNGASYVVANTFNTLPTGQYVDLGTIPHKILSRSNEVQETTLWTNNRSAVVRITVTSSSPYTAPVINDRNSDFIVYKNQISNTYQRQYSNSVYYDSEIGFNGAALSKHITKKMTFDNNLKAEDLVVYMSAYRPAGTSIRLYARIHNAGDEQPFDDKLWTPLTLKSTDKNSSVDNHDFIEYQYGLPQFPGSSKTLTGKFTTANNSVVVTAVGGTPNSEVAVGNVVKIYNELFPENYIVAPVTAANTTTFSVNQPILYNGILGAGQKVDVMEFGQTAYNNKSNFNIVRYYNDDNGVFDGYNTVQIKAVLLADSSNIVPEIDQLEVIGVSA